MLCQSLTRAPAAATFRPAPFLARTPLLRHRTLRRSSSSIKMSSQFIEHVVLFNVKEDTPASQIDAMVSNLSSLRSLDVVLHLTAGPIHRLRSPPPPKFTHLLHSRYRTKEDLAAYSAHPDHISCVRQFVLPICDDLLAADWVSPDLSGSSPSPSPGSAFKLQFVKLKEEAGEEGKREVLGAIGGVKDKIAGVIDEVSFGENFSPARAKGFSVCSIGFFPSLGELEKVEGDEEMEKVKEKVRGFIDGLIVADYMLPSASAAASL